MWAREGQKVLSFVSRKRDMRFVRVEREKMLFPKSSMGRAYIYI
jgi:hypothetical protein